jgi:CheY-like chemotaxis protein
VGDPHPTILVVDEEAELGRLLALMVACTPYAGYTVAHARNAQGGLDLAQRTPPALILLDLCTAVVDGYAFLRAYHTLPGARGPVVLFSVAYDRTDPWLQAYTADLLPKPFSMASLTALLARHLPVVRDEASTSSSLAA